MQNIINGKKVGLGMENNKCKTFININVLNEKKGYAKEIKCLIDTGFDGYLQLSQSDTTDLGLDVINKSSSALADGSVIETGITKSKIRILDEEIFDFPIQFTENAVALIGTQLLRDTKKMIIFDYEDGYVTLTRDISLKDGIKSFVEKSHN